MVLEINRAEESTSGKQKLSRKYMKEIRIYDEKGKTGRK
ncbi:hypothetical protein BSM4216_2570 [Bacillus smithii]|jgi:hypothetical protein|nr:hypothetical protein BSM4216_2570 [Bacillus smithii]